ncbi:type II toxin-antitoxin system VapC family toxin [Pelagicoccus sp. SDUM812005]|uniref:type II toxin-antitoxin system VapC family toxin n=1 Tax=Pelagicoccus sp. SDUM812005 TaxID=3041257 RepID=UPI00280D36C7|nr:type II toxin-antitoxin system VapC family toxin [Pelagicoccus sp. SDUM812005]MDQ8180819.1 type II toxin-antitoxin system VapC family toxin [Pelagicoccus sp. SDUM812005]
MAKITLDTNAYSAFMKGDEKVLDTLASATTVYLPLFVIGELHYGFRGGSKLQENLSQLKAFLNKPTVDFWLPTLETAQIYGETQDQLKRAGSPIPINDIWIASACIESGSTLVTFDQHFRKIPGLRLWPWI